ncbi:MAG TPA: hypothetical protein VLA16_00035, partial [Ideonella sp.]|nr:hypothetical protein [Ideonella sp.]
VPALATPGLVALPGTGRLVWWTGRVAIGLRYQRAGAQGTPVATSSSSTWLQSMLLRAPRSAASRRPGATAA